jgi:hypothetical protein
MFSPDTFQQDKLKQLAKTMNGCDPELLEKALYALTLLAHLQEAKIPLIFHGGTSLLLHFPEPFRLSVDVDIISPIKEEEWYDEWLSAAVKPPFIKFKEDVRGPTRLPQRRHFKFFYASSLGVRTRADPYILLDIVFEPEIAHFQLESKVISTGFAPAMREVFVQIPKIDSLLGDKLTAFAPFTTGVSFKKSDKDKENALQVVKQLFDIGVLFEKAVNGNEIANTYSRVQCQQSSYRGGVFSIEETLEDTINACLFTTNLQSSSTSKYCPLKKGFHGLSGHLVRKVSEKDFRLFAARVAVLAAHIKTKTPIMLEKLRYQGTEEQIVAIKRFSFNNTKWTWINKLRQIDPETYHHWMTTHSLLQ